MTMPRIGLTSGVINDDSVEDLRYLKIDGSNANIAIDIGSENFATTGTITAGELFNTGGDLKIQPDVQGDVILFGDTDVTNATTDGKSLYIYRMEGTTDGDNYMRFYINQYENSQIIGGTGGRLDITALGTNLALNSNSTNTLKLNRTANADIECFSDTDVGAGVDGKIFKIHRKAAAADYYHSQYIDQWGSYEFIGNTTGIDIQCAAAGLVQISTGSDLALGSTWMGSGQNPFLKMYGYITAKTNEEYIQFVVSDTTDYFELTREDTNILGFDVQMPMVADDLTLSSTLDLANGRVSEYRTLCIPVTNPTATDDYLIYRFKEAVTILNVFGVCMDGTSVVFQIMECDGDGDNAAQICNAVTATVSNTQATITNATVDAGDYISYDSSANNGSVTKMLITIEYKID